MFFLFCLFQTTLFPLLLVSRQRVSSKGIEVLHHARTTSVSRRHQFTLRLSVENCGWKIDDIALSVLVHLKVFSGLMIVYNVDNKYGLTNGQLGAIVGISYSNYCQTDCGLVQFDDNQVDNPCPSNTHSSRKNIRGSVPLFKRFAICNPVEISARSALAFVSTKPSYYMGSDMSQGAR